MYICPLDILNISLDELATIDDKGIIRLEKRLKLLSLQKDTSFYNQEQLHTLLDELKDIEKRKSIVFIEKHPHLKSFISTGKDVGPKTFLVDEELLNNTPNIDNFLAPYFENYFIPLLKRDYNNKKYDTIIQAINTKALFLDTILFQCYKYIEQQTKILIEKIVATKPGSLYKKSPEVTYKTLILLLNSVPIGLIKSTKIDYVNSLIDYYSRTETRFKEFKDIKRAYRLFANITMDNEEIRRQIHANSSIGFKKGNYEEEETSDDSLSITRTMGLIIAIIIAVIRFMNSSSHSSSIGISNNDYNINNIFKEAEERQQKEQDFFLATLLKESKNIRSKETDSLLYLKTGQNPYPQIFSRSFIIRDFGSYDQKRMNNFIYLKNNLNNPMIIFTKDNGSRIKRAMFVNGKDSLKFLFSRDLHLTYYIGNYFRKTKTFKKGIFTSLSDKNKVLFLKEFRVKDIKNNPEILIEKDTILYKNILGDYTTLNYKNIRTPLEIRKAVKKQLEDVIVEEIEIETEKEKPFWNTNKQVFFKKLKNATAKNSKKINFIIENGENPYPEDFKSRNHSSISGYEVVVKNNSKDKHLIVFNANHTSERNFAVYIKPNHEIPLFLHERGDELRFYVGSYFTGSKTLKTLKQNSQEQKLFLTSYKINGFLLDDPMIEINNSEVKIKNLVY